MNLNFQLLLLYQRVKLNYIMHAGLIQVPTIYNTINKYTKAFVVAVYTHVFVSCSVKRSSRCWSILNVRLLTLTTYVAL